MPAKRTLPVRRPLSSRTSKISPGIPRHIEILRRGASGLLFGHHASAHFYLGIDLQHQDARRRQPEIADIENLLAFEFQRSAVNDPHSYLALYGFCHAVQRQIAAHPVTASGVEFG